MLLSLLVRLLLKRSRLLPLAQPSPPGLLLSVLLAQRLLVKLTIRLRQPKTLKQPRTQMQHLNLLVHLDLLSFLKPQLTVPGMLLSFLLSQLTVRLRQPNYGLRM